MEEREFSPHPALIGSQLVITEHGTSLFQLVEDGSIVVQGYAEQPPSLEAQQRIDSEVELVHQDISQQEVKLAASTSKHRILGSHKKLHLKAAVETLSVEGKPETEKIELPPVASNAIQSMYVCC
jgi:hypothetical protein